MCVVIMKAGVTKPHMKYASSGYTPYAYLYRNAIIDCKLATNCYITNNENFFGSDKFDQFDAVVIEPEHLKTDVVWKYQPIVIY